MRAETARQVRRSWESLRGQEERVAGSFYARLFSLDPELRHLFVLTDMGALREKLVATLDLVTGTLEDPDALASRVEASGRRHALYGVGPREYRLGGEALLWALEKHLGEGFTAEVKGAWAEAYTLLAHLMLRVGSGGT